jgi:hypothetical protein
MIELKKDLPLPKRKLGRKPNTTTIEYHNRIDALQVDESLVSDKINQLRVELTKYKKANPTKKFTTRIMWIDEEGKLFDEQTDGCAKVVAVWRLK